MRSFTIHILFSLLVVGLLTPAVAQQTVNRAPLDPMTGGYAVETPPISFGTPALGIYATGGLSDENSGVSMPGDTGQDANAVNLNTPRANTRSRVQFGNPAAAQVA